MRAFCACRKYRKLRLQSLDGELSARAFRFVELHSEQCAACRLYDQQIAAITEALRNSAVANHGSPGFGERVQKRVVEEWVRRHQAAWRPAFIGAVAAAAAMAATLQAITASELTPPQDGSAVRERVLENPAGSQPAERGIVDAPSRLVDDPERTDA